MEVSLELERQPDAARMTLPRMLDDLASRHGRAPALRVAGEGGETVRELDYETLREDAHALARGLVGTGVGKGTRVAVWMGNNPDWVVAAFAVSLAGGVLVPLNTFATADERSFILRHSDAAVLLMQPTLLGRDLVAELLAAHPALPGATPGRLRCADLPCLRAIHVLGDAAAARGGIGPWSSLLAAGADVEPSLLAAIADEVHPSDDAVLIYTSGTTAHPKGVLHMQRAPVIQSWRFGESMGLCPDDLMLTAQPFFWTAGITMSLGAALTSGTPLLLEEKFDAGRFLELVETCRVTTLNAWPHQEKAMAEHPDAARRDLRSLRHIEFSSPLAPLAGLERDEWGTYGSYGASETFTLSSSLPASAPAALRRDTSGRPLPGMQLKIVDPETGLDLTEPGQQGEIAVRGITFMRGYYKVAPELYLDDHGFFHTQDGGHFDEDGYLHWSGRLSNLIKTGGANVSPLEIESALADREELRIAQAVGVPHPVLGEVIVLCVVPAQGAQVDAAALIEHLRARLARYKVPRHVLQFGADELAFTSNQKLQVGALRDQALRRLEAEGVTLEGVTYRPAAPVGA